jgi:hypothetical protein
MSPKLILSEASSVVIQGCLSFEFASEFLKKDISFRQLIHRCKRGKTDHCTKLSKLAFALKMDAKHEASKSGSRFAAMIGRSIYFAVAPLTSPWVAALRWNVDWRKCESFTPVLLPIDVIEDVFCMTNSPPWLEVLARLQEIPLRSLIRCFAIANDTARVGIEDEIRNRIQQFGKYEHAFYFQDSSNVLAWDIASRHPSWETGKIPLSKRREEIISRWRFNLSESEFKAFTPGPFLASLSPMPPKSVATAPLLNARIVDKFYSREIRRQFIGRDKSGNEIFEELAPFPFSRGGYFEEFLFRSEPKRWRRFPVPGELKSEEKVCNALWWWKYIPNWPQELRDEFPDNWEHSAFLYEFRARILPEHTWDFFDNPWFDLDVSQRAALFYIWPPGRIGKHFRQGRISTDTKWEHDFRESEAEVKVDPTQPIRSAMAKYETEFRYQRSILLGLQEGPNRSKPAPNKHWRWELIEALDGQHFFEHRLNNSDIKRLARAKKEYQSACAAAGLPPYESVRARNWAQP